MSDISAVTTEKSRLEACSAEPIRTPGSIQAHGVLLGVDRASRQVVVVSENSETIGTPPQHILGKTVEELIGTQYLEALRDAAQGNNPVPVTIGGQGFDAIVHRGEAITFVEFEPHEQVSTPDPFPAVFAASQRISTLETLDELLESITVEFAALTGFDRVMVYDFHPDGHGEVVSETHIDGMEPYLGLHFPASDIPAQARELYLSKVSRAIVSTSKPSVPLVTLPEFSALQVDLSVAELRSVSPFHLQFMRNMGQASTVSFSLIRGGRLIGMITCASNTERRLPFTLRRGLEVLARQISFQLGSGREIQRLQREVQERELRSALLSKLVASDLLAEALLDGDITVRDLVPADSAAVRLDGKVSRTAGAPPVRVLESLGRAVGQDILETSALATTHPLLVDSLPGTAGVLFVPLQHDGDYLAFFRNEVIQSVNWLGDLAEQNRATTLAPRVSFSAWTQSVSGTSLPWGDHVRTAEELARDINSALVRRAESRLATLALHDPLTGLANRRSLMDEFDRALTGSGELSVLFLDLDDFKSINDTFGHEAGDEVLIELGRRLVAHTRAEDCVARLGGDEFVILSVDTTDADAEAIARRIVAAVREPIGDYRVTASVGVVTVEANAVAAEVLQRGDAAMYRAKQAGRNRVSR